MFPTSLSSAGGRIVSARVVAFVLFLFALSPALAEAQLGLCGTVGGYFQVDGQFYSSSGLHNWAQGTGGTGVLNNDGSPAVLPALHDRDPHWAGNATDPDHFAGSGNKNNDDISPGVEPWEWGPGSGPAKNDLTDVYAHSANLGGDVWLFLGAMTRANNGASHVDFEFNQAGFTQTGTGTGSGQIVGNGDDAGRTADVDFIVSVDFESGGNVPTVSFRVWEPDGLGYAFIQRTPDPGDVFVCTNDQEIPAPPWGAVSNGGDLTDVVEPFQLVEIGVNLTGLGIDPRVFCSDVSTLLFKTRSAPSFSAELKDLALYKFSIFPTPDCTITADLNPLCEGETAQLCAPLPPLGADYTYTWMGPDGPYADARCITAAAGGTYSLVVTDNTSGCRSDTCRLALTVNPLPPCTITADRTVVCDGETAQFCGPAPPAGDAYSYAWTGPDGLLPDQRCITVGTAGEYRLTVTSLGSGCTGSTCSEILDVLPLPPNTISGSGFICQDSTTTLCGPEGDYSYAWSGPTGPSSGRCLTTGVQGTYTLVVTSNATGCSSLPGTHDVIVADNPGCSIEGPDTVCPGGEISLCGPEGDFTYAWTGPGGPSADRCRTVTEGGLYSLMVTDGNGCLSVCEKEVTLDENVSASSLDDLWLCTGDRAEFCTSATGTGPITYQWALNGAPIAGATDSCYVVPEIGAGDVGTYSVTVTGKCSEVTRRADLALADVTVSELRGLYLCEGQEARLCPEVSGRGPFTFQWTRDGVPVGTDSCLVIGSVTPEDEGEYCVTVTGYCGDPVVRCGTVLVGDCVEYCGLTQGFYGNAGGKWNGWTTLELLDYLITENHPLVIGIPGLRSVTYPEGTEACVIEHLPGVGHPGTLREGLGDVTVEPDMCTTVPEKVQKMPGRIRNNLYTQVVTLSLNTRLDPELPDLPLCETIIMIGTLPGPDGIHGTEDDIPNNDDVRIVHIPLSIFAALNTMSLPHTAGGLLTLANTVLADALPADVEVSPSDVTGAIGSVNDLVDDCALTIHCESAPRDEDPSRRRELIAEPTDAGAAILGFQMLAANPIRQSEGFRLRFRLPEDSDVRVVLYDVSGRLVGGLMDRVLSSGEHTVDLNGTKPPSSGIYFLKLEARGLQSGDRIRQSRKVLVLP